MSKSELMKEGIAQDGVSRMSVMSAVMYAKPFWTSGASDWRELPERKWKRSEPMNERSEDSLHPKMI